MDNIHRLPTPAPPAPKIVLGPGAHTLEAKRKNMIAGAIIMLVGILVGFVLASLNSDN